MDDIKFLPFWKFTIKDISRAFLARNDGKVRILDTFLNLRIKLRTLKRGISLIYKPEIYL